MKQCSMPCFILAITVIVYILGGAAIFQLLESDHEQLNRQAAVDLVREFLENNTCVDKGELLRFVAQTAYLKDKGVIISNSTQSSTTNWNYPNSLFFAITVVTTIGYGNISPTNDSSRAFCLVFAIVGIPLYLLILAKIGSCIAAYNSSMVERCCGGKGARTKFIIRLLTVVIVGSGLFVFVPSAIFMHQEGWSFFLAFYSCIITFSTIGFGDYVPGAKLSSSIVWTRLLYAIWIAFGLAWFASIISTIQDMISRGVDNKEGEQEKEAHENHNGTGMNGNGVKSTLPNGSQWVAHEDIVAHL